MNWTLEVIVVPVSNIDRAKDFYTNQLGFTVDHDTKVNEQVRVVQLTPPGSGCSIVIGSGIAYMPPGSLKGLQLVVKDVEAARDQLVQAGVAVSEITRMGEQPDNFAGEPLDNIGFIFFDDPDGNSWAVQQISTRAKYISDERLSLRHAHLFPFMEEQMATIREGNKQVLVVVDVQAGVMQAAWDAARVIKNIGLAVEKARANDVPVVWVQHADDELVYGTPEWQWVSELSPAENEPRIDKHFNSSFEQTTLEETLADYGAAHIVLAGAATNWCIRATAYGALERGYDLTLLKDAHTTESMELANGVTIEAARVVDELNIGMTWVSYPDRTNDTATVEEINFAL